MPPVNRAFPERFSTLDIFVEGCFCDASGCCRPIAQMVHGRVYAGGDSFVAWHLPGDPVRGGHYSNADLGAGQEFLGIWQGWADATE